MPELEKKPRAKYTIRDVARMTGFSRSTVSLALNDSPKIKSKTKDEILKFIENVGYRPNQAARNLVSKNSGTICVILPKIEHVVSDVYFSESLSGILETLTQRELHTMVEMATDSFKLGRKALELYSKGIIEGVLCIGCLTTDAYLAELSAAGCPVVLVNSSLDGVAQVTAANVSAAYRAVHHLHSLGHRRIAHIRGSEFVTTALHRTDGYLQAVEALKLDSSEELIAQGYFDQQSGYDAMKWLLSFRKKPTAVFATNDVMAIGAMQAIEDAGLRVPQDIAVFGGDDILLAQYVKPQLSTMRQPMYAISQMACDQLIRLMEGNGFTGAIEVELELVIRESCGAALKDTPRPNGSTRRVAR